jgi:hypothetical protein
MNIIKRRRRRKKKMFGNKLKVEIKIWERKMKRKIQQNGTGKQKKK